MHKKILDQASHQRMFWEALAEASYLTFAAHADVVGDPVAEPVAEELLRAARGYLKDAGEELDILNKGVPVPKKYQRMLKTVMEAADDVTKLLTGIAWANPGTPFPMNPSS